MKQRLNENNDRKESELLVFIKAKDLSAYVLLISGLSVFVWGKNGVSGS